MPPMPRRFQISLKWSFVAATVAAITAAVRWHAMIRHGQLPNFDHSFMQRIGPVSEQTKQERAEVGRIPLEQLRGFLGVVRSVSIARHNGHGVIVARRLIEIPDLPAVPVDEYPGPSLACVPHSAGAVRFFWRKVEVGR